MLARTNVSVCILLLFNVDVMSCFIKPCTHLFALLQMATMDYAEIRVEQKYHRHIIGKGGASGKFHTHKYTPITVLHTCNILWTCTHENV